VTVYPLARVALVIILIATIVDIRVLLCHAMSVHQSPTLHNVRCPQKGVRGVPLSVRRQAHVLHVQHIFPRCNANYLHFARGVLIHSMRNAKT
jgi:hypothetical protein